MARATAQWKSGILHQIEELGRWFGGRFVIEPDPDDEVLEPGALLDPDTLREAIVRSASITLTGPSPELPRGVPAADSATGDVDLRVAVSRFARHYSASLTTVALAGLGRGVGISLAAERCRMVVRHNLPWAVVVDQDDAEILRCAERPTDLPVGGPVVGTVDELRERVWRDVYAGNLWPVLSQAIEIGSITPGVVWTNAAEWPALVSDAALEYLTPEEAEPFTTEAHALLDAPALPGVPEDVNPLRDRIEWVDGDGQGFPEKLQSRELCCLTYLLADRAGRLCQSCPYLPVSDRIALIRERHGVPMGSQGGAAEQRSIERGMSRPSMRRALSKRGTG